MDEKIYCTKCGREIKAGLLYCDRCGQSVKKSMEAQGNNAQKRKQIEQLQQERLNRKKRMEERERQRLIRKKKAAKRAKFLIIAATVLVIAILSASISYITMSDSDSGIQNMDDTIQSDIESVVKQSAAPARPADIRLKLYKHDTLSCPYPVDFSFEDTTGTERIRVSKPDAEMLIFAETTNKTAKNLMVDYVNEANGTVTFSRAGEDWYAVTFETDKQTVHRKCIIDDNTSLYYDFTYDTASKNAPLYASYIEAIDDNFSTEGNSRR